MNSDGGGRSGVFMSIDANLESVEEDGVMEVFGYLKKLRQARRGLVETLVRRNKAHNVQIFVRKPYMLMTVAGAIQVHLRYAGRGNYLRSIVVSSLGTFHSPQTEIHSKSRH